MPIISEKILTQFTSWFEEARAHPAIRDHHAMSLGTCDANGRVSVRMVLLKQFDADGFIFFTNYHGRKSHDIAEHSNVALCLYWEALGKQIRIEGKAVKATEAESDAYFNARPRQSQIGAWASEQSEVLPDMGTLKQRVLMFEEKFADAPVPRPPHWGGWRVIPDRIEFWNEGSHRLHERQLFVLSEQHWSEALLYP